MSMQIYSQDLPPFEKFKKVNFIAIKPHGRKNMKKSKEPPLQTKAGQILNNSKYHVEIKDKLRTIYEAHIKTFINICDEVIQNKYNNIYKYIYEFTLMSNSFDMLNSLIINTDQNSGSFFDGLKKYLVRQIKNNGFYEKFDLQNIIIPRGENHFKDINKLFTDLNIENLNYEMEEDGKTKTRIIVVGEIHRIDQINLNLFLMRLMEYQSDPRKQFNNLVLFDVVYDPRSLFDKIKPNILTKMIFYSIENIPSRNIYQEVLYKFIYEKNNSLFIPNSTNTKIIVDYVNNHQISVESFKHYFKFLIFQFFFMHSWDNDIYIIFGSEFNKLNFGESERPSGTLEPQRHVNEEQIKNVIQQKLQEVYQESDMYNEDDLKEISGIYIDHLNSRKLFGEYYNMLEKLLEKLVEKNEGIFVFNKFQFFFDFLQYGAGNSTLKNRCELLRKYFQQFPDQDYVKLINEYIFPIFEGMVSNLFKMNPGISGEEYNSLTELLKEIKGISEKADDPQFHQTSEDILREVLKWFRKFFSLNAFSTINEFDIDEKVTKKKRKWLNIYKYYISFSDIANPSMMNIIMNDLLTGICKVNEDSLMLIKEKDFSFENTLKCFIKCFMRLGSFFKLKLFFWEFLNELGVLGDDKILASEEKEEIKEKLKENKKIARAQEIFLYFSYVFCLIGFFSRKKGNGEFYQKNYFSITNYFIKK